MHDKPGAPALTHCVDPLFQQTMDTTNLELKTRLRGAQFCDVAANFGSVGGGPPLALVPSTWVGEVWVVNVAVGLLAGWRCGVDGGDD